MAPPAENNRSSRQEAFRQQASDTCHYARAFLNSRNLGQYADDATHIAWLIIYDRLGNPDCEMTSPRSYMLTTAYHQALALQREACRYEPLGAFHEPGVDPLNGLNCDETERVTPEAVLKAICALPRELSEVIAAWAWDDLSQQALAEQFCITRYRLIQIVAEARQAVRAWLRDQGYDFPHDEECA